MALDYACKHKEQLDKLYTDNVITNKEFYKHWVYNSYMKLSPFSERIKDDEWSHISRVSIFDQKIMGYFGATLCNPENIVSSIQCLYLHPKTLSIGFIRDFELFVAMLFKEFHVSKIEFEATVDNPANRLYDAYLNKHGGTVIGVSRKHLMLIDRKMHDCIFYEILREEWHE